MNLSVLIKHHFDLDQHSSIIHSRCFLRFDLEIFNFAKIYYFDELQYFLIFVNFIARFLIVRQITHFDFILFMYEYFLVSF